jgi:hypothetical protein
MSLENINCVLSKFREQYFISAKELGYSLVIGYDSTKYNLNGELEICVDAEFKNMLKENSVDKTNLRKLIPKKYSFNSLDAKVYLKIKPLPFKIKKTLSELKKTNTPPTYF